MTTYLMLVGVAGLAGLFLALVLSLFFPGRDYKPFKKLWLKSGKDYVLSKAIFKVAFIIIFIGFAVLIGVYGLKENIYYKCDPPVDRLFTGATFYCDNPFYMEPSFTGKVPPDMIMNKTLPPGYTFGKPTPAIINHFPELILGVLALAFLANHLAFNIKGKVGGGFFES